MTSAPVLSIIMPLFNDETTLTTALQSALQQTVADIEVVCVDDASTDGTTAIIETFAARDHRVRLIRQHQNRSAFQARRAGVMAARAAHVLFLDGDDELVPDAAERTLKLARDTGADLVGFGVTVIERDGATGGSYEARLQPRHTQLMGSDVLAGLFPIGKPAQGQLWRFLFRTCLLREAYELLPSSLVLPRMNDLPLMFVTAAIAKSYVSMRPKLYRYHFGRGGSGQVIDTAERAAFYVSAIHSIESIRAVVLTMPPAVRESYESVRLSIIGYVTSQLMERSEGTVRDEGLARLGAAVAADDVVRGAAQFYPHLLRALSLYARSESSGTQPVRSILLATATLRTGGVTAVVCAQAKYLTEAGFRVTVATRSHTGASAELPAGVSIVNLPRPHGNRRVDAWRVICREYSIDFVIDHEVLYSREWPELALAGRAEGAMTIGWLHNFVGRPIADGSDQLSFIERCAGTLAGIVTLSPLDVAYFKSRGIERTWFLPNPPSAILRAGQGELPERSVLPTHIELIWWGRLEQRTKQVLELIEIGVHLRRAGVDFRLRVIGPDWDDMTAKKFNAEARRRHVGDSVIAEGPLHGDDLVRAIDEADVFVSTSIIEGYQLTIAEAQARGLPVFMYDLPWLILVQDNDGVVSVPQGDAAGLARSIVDVMQDPDRYRELSEASVVAAQKALSHDFAALYRGVVEGTLPPEFSPQPTAEDARRLLGLMVFYAERAARAGRARTPQNDVDPSALGARVWGVAAPLGREALKRLPGLRPLAHKAKGWLRAR